MIYRYTRNVASLLMVVGVIIAIATQTASASQAAQESIETIDAYITEQMNELKIPGVAIGIVRGDQVVHVQGYGIADDSGRVMTANTPFLIASLSKSITALGIMQLVEEGKIDLDAPVQTYLPWFQVADEEVSSQITIRHLLNQTSGFSEREGYERNLNTNPADDALEQSIRDLNKAKLNFSPGEEFEYSNTNYDLLGLIIQAVSGQSYETYIEEKIFAPLDMDNSYTTLDDARVGNMTRGYYPFFGFPIPYDHLMPYSQITKPSAGLFSSAEDLTHYLIAHMNEGQYQGSSILSPDGINELHTIGISFSDNAGYAMGWTVFSFPDMAAAAQDGRVPNGVSNAGEWVGYTSLLVLIPELETGIVLLMNKNDPTRMPELFNLGWSLSMLAVGLEPLEAGSADFVGKNILVLLIIVILLLVAGLVWSVRGLRQLSSQSGIDAQQRRKLNVRMALLAIVDLSLAGGLLFVRLPETNDTLSLALRFSPDIGLMYILLLLLTLGWGTIRTLLFFIKYRTANA